MAPRSLIGVVACRSTITDIGTNSLFGALAESTIAPRDWPQQEA